MVFDDMKKELNELVNLVRKSERYCTMIAAQPELATDATHALEIEREIRIAELSVKYGISS